MLAAESFRSPQARLHAFLRVDSLTVGLLLLLGQIPSLHGLVSASREQVSAVGAESDTVDEPEMAAEIVDQLSAAGVPNLHGGVLPGRGDPPTLEVGAEGRRPDVPAVSPEDLH